MPNVNTRRSIRTALDISFESMWFDGEAYNSLIEAFEFAFPDAMRLARVEIEAENPNPVRRTIRRTP